MRAKKWVEFTIDDVAIMAAIIRRHVKPEDYKPGGECRAIVEACHTENVGIRFKPEWV